MPLASWCAEQRRQQALTRGLGRGVARLGRVVEQGLGVATPATPTSWLWLSTFTCRSAFAPGAARVPGVGRTGPGQVGRDLERSVRADRGVGDCPRHPLVEDLLRPRRHRSAGSSSAVALHLPDLEAEPAVRRRVVPDRVRVVEHAVEGRRTGGRRAVVAVPAVRDTAGDAAVGRLQPLQDLQLPVEALGPVLLTGRRLRLQRGHLRQRVRRQRVLVALVRGAVTDPPRPARRGVGRAAPGVVPGHQVVRAVLAGARGAGAGPTQLPIFLKYLSNIAYRR